MLCSIYFHKTCRAVQLMLTNAMRHLAEEVPFWDYREPTDYLRWDDYTMWSNLIQNPASADYMEDIRRRRLWKCTYESAVEITEIPVNFTEDGMRERIAEMNWRVVPSCSTQHKHDRLFTRMLSFLENRVLQCRLGEFKNYILLDK